MEKLKIPQRAGFRGETPHVAELDQISKKFPQEPFQTTWRLVKTHMLSPSRRRRLDARSLEESGFVRGPLEHPYEAPPTTSELRSNPNWRNVRSKELKAKRPPLRCDTATLWKAMECLHLDTKKECVSELRQLSIDCRQLVVLVSSEIRSTRCKAELAVRCGGLLRAYLTFEADDTQDVIAAFLDGTSASYLPDEAIVAIIAQQKPSAALLTSLSRMVVNARDETRPRMASDENSGWTASLEKRGLERGTLQDWALIRLLQPAAGAVYHARHGFGSYASAVPPALQGDMGAAAATISAVLLDELHTTLAYDDASFNAHHEAAWADVHHTWEQKFTLHEREAAAAEQALVASHEGLQWELDAGRLHEHEAASRDVLKRELLYRRRDYDFLAEEEHLSRLSELIKAVGNLGAAPEDEGGHHLLANVTACHDHRSPRVVRAATAALRRHPHPHAEESLRGVLRRPPTKEHREARMAAVDALMEWSNVSAATVSHALDELRRLPMRTVEACRKSCRRHRNPHLHHYGDHRMECKLACEHETQHVQALLRLVRRAAHDGHAVEEYLQAPTAIQASTASAESAGSSLGGAVTDRVTGHRRRLGVGSAAYSGGAKVGSMVCGMGGGSCASAAAGVAATALCYLAAEVPFIKQVCVGIEIVMGMKDISVRKEWNIVRGGSSNQHSSIPSALTRSVPCRKFCTPVTGVHDVRISSHQCKLPLLGPVGFEVSLNLANSIWAKFGIFDGGYGVNIGNEAKAEFFFGPVRVSIVHLQLKWKFDFTYCTVCTASVLAYIIEDMATVGLAVARGEMSAGEAASQAYQSFPGRRLSSDARRLDFKDPVFRRRLADDVMNNVAAVTQRVRHEDTGAPPPPAIVVETDVVTKAVLNPMNPPSLLEALADFRVSIGLLELDVKVNESILSAPPPVKLAELLTAFVQETSQLAGTTKVVLRMAAQAHAPFMGITSPLVASASAAFDVAASPQAVGSLVAARDATHALVGSLDRHTAGHANTSQAGGAGPLRVTLDLVTQASRPVAQLEAELGAITSGLNGTAALANWLHALGDTNTPSSLRPSPQQQASAVLDLANRIDVDLDRANAAIADGIDGLGMLTPPDACPAAGSVAARVALQSYGGHYGSLCCSVRRAISETAFILGADAFGNLRTFLRALNRREWSAAADQFMRQHDFCHADRARCERLQASIRAGCAAPDHWTEPPSLAQSSFSVSNARVVASADPSADPSTRQQVVIAFDAHLTVRGKAHCAGQSVSVESLFTQRDVRMTMVTAMPDAIVDAAAIGSRIELSADGIVRLPPLPSNASSSLGASSNRWWSSHEQLVLRAHLVRHLRLADVTLTCESVSNGLPLEHIDEVLLSPSVNTTSALSSLFIVQRLLGHTESPVMLQTAHCTVECARGALMPKAADTSRPTCASHDGEPSDSVQVRKALSAVGVPGHVFACLHVLQQDYGTCGLAKDDSDARFGTCVRQHGTPWIEAPPVDPAELATWWIRLLHSHGVVSPTLVASFDCATFAQHQQASCRCDMATFHTWVGPDPLAATGVRCLTESVGFDADVHAVNRQADASAVRVRLSALGYLSEPGPQLEHTLRVFLCAAAGVISMEQVCAPIAAGEHAVCAVEGSLCPHARRVPERGTCMSNHTCAAGRIQRGSKEHDWLKSRNAPSWVQLASSGCGFEVIGHTPQERLRTWSSKWVAEALVHAGRSFVHSMPQAVASSEPHPIHVIHVVAASLREGGMVPGTSFFQTGLEVEVKVPETSAVAHAQMSALIQAGFDLFDSGCTTDCPAANGTDQQGLAISKWRARLHPPDLMEALADTAAGMNCSSAHDVEVASPQVVSVTNDPAAVFQPPIAELQAHARGLNSLIRALDRAWDPRSDGRDAAVRTLLPHAHALGRALQSRGPAALQLANSIHQLHRPLKSMRDPELVSMDNDVCQWAHQLSSSVPSDSLPYIPTELLRTHLDTIAADNFASLENAVAAINTSAIISNAEEALEALRVFAPGDLLVPMKRLAAAHKDGLLQLNAYAARLRPLEPLIQTANGVASAFNVIPVGSNVSQRAARHARALELMEAGKKLLAPKTPNHPFYRFRMFAEIDAAWEPLWYNITRHEAIFHTELQRAIAGYRVYIHRARNTSALLLRAAKMGTRIQPAMFQMLRHVSSSFHDVLASTVHTALHNLSSWNFESQANTVEANVRTLPGLPKQATIEADIATLSNFIGSTMKETMRFGGEDSEIKSLLVQLDDELEPRTVPRSVPFLKVFVQNMRNELQAAQRLNGIASRLSALRQLVSGAAEALCPSTRPGSTIEAAATSRHISISTVRETERLFAPSSSFGSVLEQIQELLLAPVELQGCLATPGCTRKQRDLLQAAARALGAYAAVLEEAGALLTGGDVTVQSTIDGATERVARLHAGGKRLAQIGVWTRSLSQPGLLDTQLRRAECGGSLGDVTNTADASCLELGANMTHDGYVEATALARLASSAVRWTREVRKVSSTLLTMQIELDDMKAGADALLIRTRGVAHRLGVAAHTASQMPRLATALQVAKNVSARVHAYVEDLTRACDSIARLLDQPATTWSPHGAWITRDPSAFSHGPGSWEGGGAALAQLELAHVNAAREGISCSTGSVEPRTVSLEFALPSVLNKADDPGLFYSASSGPLLDAQAQATCLVSELLPSLAHEVMSAERVLTHAQEHRQSERRRLHARQVRRSHRRQLQDSTDTGTGTEGNSGASSTSGGRAVVVDDGLPLDPKETCPDDGGAKVAEEANEATDPCQHGSEELEEDLASEVMNAKEIAGAVPRLSSSPSFDWTDCQTTFSDGANVGICDPEKAASMYRSCRPLHETDFVKKFIHFHFGTLPPISPISLASGKPEHWHFDRVRTRFPVPLIDSEYSMQSSTFYSLQWPIGVLGPKTWTQERETNCQGCPTGSQKYCKTICSCEVNSCFGTCPPNAVANLPERYLMTFKHGKFEECNHMCGQGLCKPTILGMANSKGRLVDTWEVMIPEAFKQDHDGVQDFCDWDTTAWVPYYGSLTGIAHTKYKQNGAVYACGRLGTSEQGGNWFLFRFRALLDGGGGVRAHEGFSKTQAYIDQAIALRWLGPETDGMTVERCILAHQPGWGGRKSADTGVRSKLWVSPMSYGADAWMATARGCPVALQSGCPGHIDDEQERCRIGKKVGADTSKAEGLLEDPECFTSHMKAKDGTKKFMEHGWHLQAETLLASFEHRATQLVVGAGVHGLAFFDNKYDESYAALGRCKGPTVTPNGFWRDFCYLEFHWFDPKLTLDKLIKMVDIISMVKRSPLGMVLGVATPIFKYLEGLTQGPAAQAAIERFQNTGDSWYLQSFRVELEVPVTFVRPSAAKILRDRDSVKNEKDYTMWYFPALLMKPLYANLLFGWGASTLVRTMKVPAGLLSLAHDSSVGALPHNLFHLAFGYGTRENRLGSTRLTDGYREENRIFLLRHPILQTVTDPKLMQTEDVLDASILGISIFRIPKIGFADMLRDSLKVDPADIKFGMPYRCKYVSYKIKTGESAGDTGLKCLEKTEEINDRGQRVAYSEMPLSLLLKFVASKKGVGSFQSESEALREREATETGSCGRGSYSELKKRVGGAAKKAVGGTTSDGDSCKVCPPCTKPLMWRKGCSKRSVGDCVKCQNCVKGKVRVNCGFDTKATGVDVISEGECKSCKNLCGKGSYSPFCLNNMHNSYKYTKAISMPKGASAAGGVSDLPADMDMDWFSEEEEDEPCTKKDKMYAAFGTSAEAKSRCADPAAPGSYETKPRKKCVIDCQIDP